MSFSDKLALSKFQPQHAYHDKKSRDKHYPHHIKRKNKLLGNVFPNVDCFPFFILTSEKDACSKAVSIEITDDDWEHKDKNCLKESIGYADITKMEFLKKDDILLKTRDKGNGFPLAGKLSDEKFKQLRDLRHNGKTSPRFSSDEDKDLMMIALEEPSIADEIVKRLNLN